jgi:ketopantoate reductase
MERAVVIGLGEVGRRLATALERAGVAVDRVTRSAGWEAATAPTPDPRLVCVREEALEGVLDRLAGVDPSTIVAVQNGWVRPLLAARGIAGRGLIWFTSKGEFFRELRPSPFAGPLAAPLAAALGRGGLAIEAVSATELAALDADKMGFNCVVGLPLAVHRLTLGDYLEQHPSEAEAVFAEAVTVCARAAGVAVDALGWAAFRRTVEPIHWVATSQAKALDLRNGAVVRLGAELGLPTPVNARLLAAAP